MSRFFEKYQRLNRNLLNVSKYTVQNLSKSNHLSTHSQKLPRRTPKPHVTLQTNITTTKSTSSTKLRKAFITTSFLTVAAATYTYFDTGFQRSLLFWSKAAPIYAVYRYTEFQCANKTEAEYDQELDKLHELYAEDILQIILSMKGFYIKIGQMGSQRDDFVPEIFLKRLRTLQNDVPPRSIEFVQNLITKELNCNWNDIFESIDAKPLGAASIGQVHRAVLKSTGEIVCVKVQYPNVEQEFSWDMTTIKSFVGLAVPAHLPFFNEIEKQFASEFDYRVEASNLIKIRKNIMPFFANIVEIPKPMLKYTTKRILTMEMLNGIPLADEAMERAEALQQLLPQENEKQEDDKTLVTTALTEAEYNAIASKLAWRDTFLNVPILCRNWTIGWLPYVTATPYSYTKPPLNLPKILKKIWKVHAHELLIDGCFNGDPHPGNILYLNNGKLGLIDYGQVKEISKETRINIAKMCVALMCNDSKEIVNIQQNGFGLATKNNNPYVLEKHGRIAWDNAGREICEGLNIQLFAEKLDQMDPIVKNPDELVMPIRMCMMLWGLSYYLKYHQRVCEELLPTAIDLLKKEDPEYLVKYVDNG